MSLGIGLGIPFGKKKGIKQPYDPEYNAGTILDNFSSISGWSGYQCTLSADSVNYIHSQGLKAVTTITPCRITKQVSMYIPEIMDIQIYIPVPTDISYIQIQFSSTTNTNLNATYTTLRYANKAGFKTGWNTIRLIKADFTGVIGGESADALMTKLRFYVASNTGKLAEITIGNIGEGITGRTKCRFGFDDSYISTYTIAFPYMQARGIKGMLFPSIYLIGSSGACVNNTQITEMFNAGWYVGAHCFAEHKSLTDYATVDLAIADVMAAENYIRTHGWRRTREPMYFAYPNGDASSYNDEIIARLRALGFLAARTTISGYNQPLITDYMKMQNTGMANYSTLGGNTSVINRIGITGGILEFTTHKIVETGAANALEVNREVIEGTIDYCYTNGIDTGWLL